LDWHANGQKRCACSACPEHAYLLTCRTHEWDKTRHLNENYEESGFVMDPNEGHGRKTRGGIRVSEADLKTDEELDDDLRRTLGKESLIHGKAAPKRPTDRQRKIIEDLQRAHGDDVRSMAMDHKRNKMQLSAGVLSELIRACQYWPKGSGVDFRVPNKKLWSN
jgi:hypothetical protein